MAHYITNNQQKATYVANPIIGDTTDAATTILLTASNLSTLEQAAT